MVYLPGRTAFHSAKQPLLWGNALFFVASQPTVYVVHMENRGLQGTVRTSLIIVLTRSYTATAYESGVADWVLIADTRSSCPG